MKLMKYLATVAVVALAAPAFAESHLMVSDAYARAASPAAKSGGVFLVIQNHGDTADRLVSAASDVADMTELHTHRVGADGVAQMVKVEEGFEIPAHGNHTLARGGDHVMLMGLKKPLNDGDSVPLTLTFESGKTLDVTVPVDLKRGAEAAGEAPAHSMGHSATHSN